MLGLIVRRLLALIPLLLVVSFAVFSLTYLLPGDPATTIAGGVNASPQDIERVRKEFGFDDPLDPAVRPVAEERRATRLRRARRSTASR